MLRSIDVYFAGICFGCYMYGILKNVTFLENEEGKKDSEAAGCKNEKTCVSTLGGKFLNL